MAELRIVSLLPAATEMVFELGLGKNLVGVSDDSDYPVEVRKLPKVVTTTLPPGLSSKEIDDHVRAAKHKGIGIFHVDQKLLKSLRPNLILSQELCEVCAVGASEIKKAARLLRNPFKTVSLEPNSVSDIFENIRMVGSITGKKKEADEVVTKLLKRMQAINHKLLTINHLPTVLIIEWVDPLMTAGHWVPEMVEIAGGVPASFARPRLAKLNMSVKIRWEEVIKADPDVLIVAPCGFDIVRSAKEIGVVRGKKGFGDLRAVRDGRVYYVDGNAYLTRPGPRIIDGIEILAEIFHPELFDRKYPKTSWDKVI